MWVYMKYKVLSRKSSSPSLALWKSFLWHCSKRNVVWKWGIVCPRKCDRCLWCGKSVIVKHSNLITSTLWQDGGYSNQPVHVRLCVFVHMCDCTFESQLRSKLTPGGCFDSGFYPLWCSDACNMALNREFSFANRAAGLSNSKIWKWKREHRSLPAYKSASAYIFYVQSTYKIKAQFGYKYSKVSDFPWEEKRFQSQL